LTGHVNYHGHTIEVTQGQLAAGSSRVEVSGTFDHSPGHLDEGRVRFRVASNPMPLDQIQAVQKLRPGAKGTAEVAADGDLDLAPTRTGAMVFRIASLNADLAARNLELDGQSLGDAHLTAKSQNAVLHAQLESDFANSAIRGEGQWRLEGNYPGSATVTFSRLDFARLRGWISPDQTSADNLSGFAEGELHIDGPALQAEATKSELRIRTFEISAAAPVDTGNPSSPAERLTLKNSGPIVASMLNNVVTIDSARFVGRSTDLSIGGKVLLQQKNPLDLRVTGNLDLAIVQEFNHDFVSSGTVVAEATVRGPLDSPEMAGRLQFQNAAFSLSDFPNGISNANGVILLTNNLRGTTRENRGTIQSFTGETGGGKIQLIGFATYSTAEAVFQLHATAEQVRVRYPEGVSTVADASLDLTGTTARSQLSGTVTILRTGFNLQSDFSSVIAKSAEPVRTPATQTGILGGLNFDVQIQTAPDIQFQSSLTEDIQMEANLRLRGTFSNPAVVGRVNITQGQMVFYGTKYTINQGSIAFYNPLKVEPILDIDLETKAHGIDITLTVAGPLNKLHLTPRSDPPLQFNEIVALLATGRAPTSDPTMLTQQSTAPQSWQQMGASTLLGQAIANPVAGRLQRFFGVSKLRIDPTIAGVENNPQARLTLEQQITPAITFTYITNVTSTNPQVIRMEWAFSKQWSAVALREENGTFGLDFFFKKRF
ncbi:MAG TPA: translocation/assembly module TamB domain-containing protein, partial [Bryobacteraceae bacterium]